MAPLNQYVRQMLHRFGWDVRRYPPQDDVFRAEILETRRRHLFRRHKITVVLDVGANTGQYAQEIRRSGYTEKIVSLEPLSDAFSDLSRAARLDPAWTALQIALGDAERSEIMNISGSSASSSFLPISSRHTSTFPGTEYVATEQVILTRLDTLCPQVFSDTDQIYLKMDVQGFEMSVLRGGKQTLPRIPVIETEICLIPLYEGQPLPGELFSEIYTSGYDLVSLEQGYAEPSSGHVLWVNGIFVRRDSSR